MQTIETPRLVLRPVIAEDAAIFFAYANDPKFYAYILRKPTEENTRERVAKWIAGNEEIPQKRYSWTIIHKKDERVIGNFRLWPKNENIEYSAAEIAYGLDPAYWGNSLTSEALIAVKEFIHDTLKIHRIESIASAENIGSWRVMEKAGFLREGECHYKDFMQGKWWKLTYEYASVRPELIPG
jgi:RimJ/RimL family protein N-acetyltransferase